MKKRLALILVVILAFSTIAGCSPKAAEPAASNEAAPQAAEKKVIYALPKEPETLDPTLNVYSRSSIVLQNLFRGLYKVGPDDRPVPALADSYTVDEAGTKYTFKIRENAKWTDGKPVTAKDFEYSWKRVLNPEVASGAAFYLYYLKNGLAYNEGKAKAEDVGVKAIDDKTLEVTLENPTAYFMDLLCITAYYPVRQDIVESGDTWTKDPSTYISDGPFMLSELKAKEKYVLKKNPNYIDADKVQLDTIEIVFIESPEAELAAYTNDEIDVSDNISKESMTKYMNTNEFMSKNRIGTYYFDINCEKKPFDDARVRRAFALSINREQLLKNIIQSVEKPAYGFVPYGIPHGVKTSEDYRNVVGNLFNENVEEAKKLLADAGYPNGQGMPEIQFITMSGQLDSDIAQAIQSMWKENLGVEVSIQTFESKVYWDEIELGNFNIARDGWTGDYPDPMTNLDLFESVNTADDIRWSSAEYDRLLAENRAIADQTKRMDNYAKAEKILMDEMPVIPLYFLVDTYLCKPAVKGVIKSYIGHTMFEYATVE
ncbi:MAG: peptide ABC transporter substrate-binding protein [Pseudomonadota bacterium]